jgi:hypothetical protein
MRTSRNINQHDWKFLRTESIDQRARAADNVADRMNEVSTGDARLQINDDQSGDAIK